MRPSSHLETVSTMWIQMLTWEQVGYLDEILFPPPHMSNWAIININVSRAQVWILTLNGKRINREDKKYSKIQPFAFPSCITEEVRTTTAHWQIWLLLLILFWWQLVLNYHFAVSPASCANICHCKGNSLQVITSWWRGQINCFFSLRPGALYCCSVVAPIAVWLASFPVW